MKRLIVSFFAIGILAVSCKEKPKSSLSQSSFGTFQGKEVTLLNVAFDGGLKASLTNYGGIITSLSLPDMSGELKDVVLGYDNLDGYLASSPYFGALIGRFGNRIANGRFTLDNVEYELATNDGVNHLHGGAQGFDKVLWEIAATDIRDEQIVISLKYLSADGEEGYPGNLEVFVDYVFTPNSFAMNYKASTDKATVVNLTQHSYFNLSGEDTPILDHELQIIADQYLPIDSTLIPTGELRPVKDGAFDFTSFKRIGKEINKVDEQLAYGFGYDHCWILNGGMTKDMRQVASLKHGGSGIKMDVYTVEPALQFYSGNFLDAMITGKNGIVYKHRYGLCLETQHYPDSPNQNEFPSVVLRPGELYETSTKYVFGVE
ncbi:MAG: aldose epimerase family protein [Cyclobacteriaceae bacterium]